MKRLAFPRLWIGVAIASFILCTAAFSKPLTIKIATLAPEGSSWMNIMREMAGEVLEKTDGQVKIKIYPGGIQGDERDVIRKMRAGQLHGGGFTGNGLGVILPSVRVLEIPFLFDSYDEIQAVVKGLGDYFEGYFDEEGYVLLGWADVGFIYLFSQQPIGSRDDIGGRKVWLWEGDPLAEAFMDGFGIKPIPLAVTDVLMSLSTKMIDTVYSSPLACVGLQWFTKVKYMLDYPLTNSVGAVIVKKKTYEKIPEELKPIVDEICDRYFEKLAIATREDNAKSRETLKKSGIEFIPAEEGGMAQFHEVSLKTREKLAGSLYPQELQTRVEDALEQYRAGKDESKPEDGA